jgi:hypothetical protein
MNGPEHYLAAEKLLARSENRTEGELDLATADAAAAQVHATLALVAAIANTASIDDDKYQLAPVPHRSVKNEDGGYSYAYPWMEALR